MNKNIINKNKMNILPNISKILANFYFDSVKGGNLTCIGNPLYVSLCIKAFIFEQAINPYSPCNLLYPDFPTPPKGKSPFMT